MASRSRPADDPAPAEPAGPGGPAASKRRALQGLRSRAARRAATLATGPGESTTLRRAGRVELPRPVDASVDVWWLEQYGGGLFLPLRDGTAGTDSYGGGRYLLDTAKGADLGASDRGLVIDLNFLYHPSCRYSEEWQCPLAPAGNRVEFALRVGERMPPDTTD